MSIQLTHFVFREAKSTSELEALFRLRYQGYLKSNCASLVQQNENGLEFDSYDWQSYHLGLFQEGQFGAKPIGYMRLVQDSPTSMAPLVSKLAARFPKMVPPPPPSADAPLPMIASCPKKEWLQRVYQSKTLFGQKVAEASRFVFSPDVRAAGYARFVIEGTLANLFFRYGFDYVLVACHPRHAPIYTQYGFQQLMDGRKNDYKGLSASILGVSSKEVGGKRAAQVQSMARQIKSQDALHLLPNSQKVSRQKPKVAVAA